MTFSRYVRTADQPQAKVFSRYVDPKKVLQDRRWIDVEVPLGRFAGEQVTLVLETTPGSAGDNRFDWAGWRQPRLFVPAER